MEGKHCIFCQIANGSQPCYEIYEDNNFKAFLDIFPRVPGHTLVIPKSHYKWVYDVSDFSDYWDVVLKVTNAMQKSMELNYANYFTYGAIKHAHIHILPRTGQPLGGENDNIDIVPPLITPKLTQDEFIKYADIIKTGFTK